jgi:hypothetical protein
LPNKTKRDESFLNRSLGVVEETWKNKVMNYGQRGELEIGFSQVEYSIPDRDRHSIWEDSSVENSDTEIRRLVDGTGWFGNGRIDWWSKNAIISLTKHVRDCG